MKLLEITLKKFGRFCDAHFAFHPKINVIFGPNEAGKSTLQQAMIALLYGFYDSPRMLQRERELHEQCRPWSSSRLQPSPIRSVNLPVITEVPVAERTISLPIDKPNETILASAQPPAVNATPAVAAADVVHEPNASPSAAPAETLAPAAVAVVSAANETVGSNGVHATTAGEYSGTLKYALNDGKTFLIHRDFSHDDVPTQLRDAVTGEDWLGRYRRGRHGKVDFIEKQIGMSRQVFLATACVQQGALRSLAERDASAVSAAILHLLDSAGTDNSAEVAIERLEKKLRELGTDRSQKALLPQARLRLEELHEDYALRLATQRAVQDEIEKAESLELELDELRTTLDALARQSLKIQLAQLETRLQRWQENERQQEKMANEIATLMPYQNFPLVDKERFFQLRHDYAHFEKLRAMLIDERDTIDLKLMALSERSKTLQVPESMWANFSFEDFLALRSRWDNNFQAIVNNENAKHDAEEALKKAGLTEAERAAFAGLDWQQLEQHRSLEAQVKEMEAEVATARQEYNQFQVVTQHRRRYAALIAFVALFALTTGFLNSLFGTNSTAASTWENVMLTISLLGMVLFMVLNIRWIARSRELGAHLLRIEDRYMEERQKLHEVTFRYRVNSIDELVQRRLQFVEIGAVIQTHLHLDQEMKKIEQALQPWMAALGLGHIAIETLQDAEKRLRESHQLWSEKTAAQKRLSEIHEKQQEIDHNLQRLANDLEAILQKAGITEPADEKAFQSFVTGCQRREYLETLRLQLQQLEALGTEILAGETSETLTSTINRLREEWQALEGKTSPTTTALSSVAPSLTPPEGTIVTAKRVTVDELSLAELQEQREQRQQEIHRKEQMRVALRERVATRLQGLLPLAEIEEEITLVEAEIKRLENAREALELARDYISQAAQRVHRDFAPRLNDFLSKYLEKLTAGRYTGAMVNPEDFSVRLQGPAFSSPIELPRLSFGTIEQVYLLLRAAVVEFFAENSESIPMLLDDPLVHADSERMIQALHIIDALADAHQIFYFTKDPVVVDYFRGKAEDCKIITLEAGSSKTSVSGG